MKTIKYSLLLFALMTSTAIFFAIYVNTTCISSDKIDQYAVQTLSNSMESPVKFKESKSEDGIILAYKNDKTMGYVRYEHFIFEYYRMVEFQCLPAMHEEMSYLTSISYASKGNNQVIMRLTVVALSDYPGNYHAKIMSQDQVERYPIEAESIIFIKRIFGASDIPQTDISITDSSGRIINW